MKIQLIYFMLVAGILSLIFSCERIPSQEKAYSVTEVKLPNEEGIPMDYGRLISVTEVKEGTAHLWFEDESSTIRMVQINYGKGLVNTEVRIIKRK